MRRALFLMACGLIQAQAQHTIWKNSSGQWSDAQHWSGGLPTGFLSAVVTGKSTIIVPQGTWVSADLQVGVGKRDQALVEVKGGQLILMQDSLHIGEDSGGEGEFILREGAVHGVMDTFVGGASEVP